MIEKPYLFSFVAWFQNPPQYILIYAEDEDSARIKGAKKLRYNCGDEAKPQDLVLRTYF